MLKKKILWTGDDFELHEINSITASACDLVLTACPLSALKYKEKGYDSLYLHGEDGKINNSISGGELLSVFRNAGLRITVPTSISVSKDGKMTSLSDKLKGKKE